MNDTFRQYVFGRSFRLDLSERLVDALAAVCRGDLVASLGLGVSFGGLLRRGLVEHYFPEGSVHAHFRPTKAGLLVFDLIVEAGEHQALEARRRETLEKEHELDQADWEERFGNIQIRLKERFLKSGAPEGGRDG